jgi:hypothetical protein
VTVFLQNFRSYLQELTFLFIISLFHVSHWSLESSCSWVLEHFFAEDGSGRGLLQTGSVICFVFGDRWKACGCFRTGFEVWFLILYVVSNTFLECSKILLLLLWVYSWEGWFIWIGMFLNMGLILCVKDYIYISESNIYLGNASLGYLIIILGVSNAWSAF